jgi:NADPH:quinone reductase-like Zn-dependent oxidoreductase
MFALVYGEYGEPEVLHVDDGFPEPHAGPRQVRVRVRAASVNPYDVKRRSGRFADGAPLAEPVIPGLDASGVVDEVGEEVAGVSVGDAVFGLGSATCAEYALLDAVAVKPPSLSFEAAAALPVAVETAARSLDLLGLREGATVVVDGAAGGVGSAAVQLAAARGLRVIGTASAPRHDYLRSLGATPTTYGPGLPERVAPLAPDGVQGALDLAGKGSVPDLVALTGDPQRVVTIADFGARDLGVIVTAGGRGRAVYALAQAAQLHAEGRFVVTIDQVFPLVLASRAHRVSEGGHVTGKLVLSVS